MTPQNEINYLPSQHFCSSTRPKLLSASRQNPSGDSRLVCDAQNSCLAEQLTRLNHHQRIAEINDDWIDFFFFFLIR